MLDATKRVRRRLAGRLGPDETLLAAVSVHRKGTTETALQGGVSGAVAAAAGGGVRFVDPEPAAADGGRSAVALDVGPYLYLALTSRRVLVLRRSAFGRMREVAFEVPVGEVAELALKPGSDRVELALRRGGALAFDTPKAPRFLPEVYRRLPVLLAEAQAGATPGRG